MKQATSTDFEGNPIKRWMLTLSTGQEVITWTNTEAEAIEKANKRLKGVTVKSIRPAGHAVDGDTPKPFKGKVAQCLAETFTPKEKKT